MDIVKIIKESGIPLIGVIQFGIIDRRTNLIQIRPSTSCNLNCTFCSTDAGIHGKHSVQYEIEYNYLIEWVKGIIKLKECEEIEANIDSVGEPALYHDLIKLIKELKSLLADAKKIDEVVKDELSEAKKKYADERKTRVISGAAKIISTEDLVPEEETILILTQGGYVKRIKPDEYRVQRRGGKGVIGVVTKEEDVAYEFISGNTHDDLLFFTNLGKVYQTKMYEIPEGTRQAKGKAIANFLSLAADENVTSILPVPKANKGEKNYVMLSTERGLTKKVEAKGFEDVRRSGIRAINLKKGDTLRFARIVSAGEEAILSTKLGQAVRFKEKDIRAMGRTAQGVRGMRLKKNDEIVGMDIITSGAKKPEILSVSSLGYGKKTSVSQYRIQKRGGSGTKTSKVTSKTGPLVSVQVVKDDQVEIIAISKKGQVIRAPLSQIPSLSRATQGVRIMKMNAGDSVASVTLL